MTGSERSSEGLDPRRRKILFRAWHRGTREMDLILGRFVDREIATLDEADLAAFERLLDAPDPALYAWISGEEPTPPEFETPLLMRLRSFHLGVRHTR